MKKNKLIKDNSETVFVYFSKKEFPNITIDDIEKTFKKILGAEDK